MMGRNALKTVVGLGINACLAPFKVKLVQVALPRSLGPDMHQLLELPLVRCVDNLGRSYSAEDNNHRVKFLQEYSRDSSIAVEDSSLYTHYTSFTHADAQNVLFAEVRAQGEAGTFVPPRRVIFPWAPAVSIQANLGDPHGNPDWGPASLERIQEEYRRTIAIFNSIRESGYRPEEFLDKYGLYPYPWGVLLKKDNDFRFAVISGKHKLAALSVIGRKTAWVKFPPHYAHAQDTIPSVIDFNNAENWPCVRAGIYTPEQAKALFLVYFRS